MGLKLPCVVLLLSKSLQFQNEPRIWPMRGMEGEAMYSYAGSIEIIGENWL